MLIKQSDKTFTDMEVFKQNRHRIRSIVHLPLRTAATFGEDIKEMMARHLTFEEAVASPDFTLMAKQRLRIIEIERGFRQGDWCHPIAVRDFIVRNVSPYVGDETFLAGSSKRTQAV